MLQFMKKWRQAYLEDKAERQAKIHQSEQEVPSVDIRKHILEAWSEASDEHYEECCRRGYH